MKLHKRKIIKNTNDFDIQMIIIWLAKDDLQKKINKRKLTNDDKQKIETYISQKIKAECLILPRCTHTLVFL